MVLPNPDAFAGSGKGSQTGNENGNDHQPSLKNETVDDRFEKIRKNKN